MRAVRAKVVGNSPNNVGSELRKLAEPRVHGEKHRVAIERVARLCGFDYWRAFDLWYGKTRRVEESERAAVKTALDKKNRDAARNEFHELKTRLAILESRLNQIDPDFHSEDVAQIRQQGRRLG